MAQYIDKDILLKAIEVKRNGLIALMNQIPYASNYPIWSSNVDLLDEVKRGIDTLEVKEVDLEVEIGKELIRVWYGEYLDLEKFEKSAKHFFELGMQQSNNGNNNEEKS